MTIKTSISLPDSQAEYARDLVERGLFSSLSAIAQHGIEVLRQEEEVARTDIEALKTLLEARANGSFIDAKTFRSNIDRRLKARLSEYVLED